MPTNDISSFVDRLVAEKGLENLDPAVLDELKKDLESRIETRVNAAILDAMPPAKLTDFNNLLDSGDSAKIQEFVQKNVGNLDGLVAATLMNFREIYLGA